MDVPVAACIITGCLFLGSLTGAAEKIGDNISYESFLENPDNYHLVDDLGRPVSQETK